MNRRLMRPAAALFPLAGFLSALLGSERLTLGLFFFYFLLQLLSLCTAEAFRNAAARELSVKKLERRFGGIWLPLLLALAAGCVLGRLLLAPWIGATSLGWLLGTAALLIAEQGFEEYLYVSGKPSDGAMLSLIAAILLFTGLLLDGGGGVQPPYPCFFSFCAAGISLLIGMLGARMFVRVPKVSFVPRNYGFGPRATVQTLTYPLCAAALLLFCGLPLPAALLGLLLWRLSRTVCRRSTLESRPLNFLLLLAPALLLIGAQLEPRVLPYAEASLTALACGLLVYCAPSARLYGGAALVGAAYALTLLPQLSQPWQTVVPVLLAVAAPVLNARLVFHKMPKR